MLNCFTATSEHSIPIYVLTPADFTIWLRQQNQFTQNWLTTTQFRVEPGNMIVLPNAEGKLEQVVSITQNLQNFWCVGNLPLSLPDATYHFVNLENTLFAMAWGLGAYQFSTYKQPLRKPAKLVLKNSVVTHFVEAIYLVRDLINMPTDDLGPTELANAADKLTQQFQAQIKHIVGTDLLKENYPLIYHVGRASDDPPRLIDLRWGNPKHPKVTLVGKGVCFDSGGLDIKPSTAMLLMKKDMGGAAHALGLAHLIMATNLKVNLRVLIPAVENSVSGNAYRPGDILPSRKGLTVEIGNTDAEGRLVLADAITDAVSEKPELLIDLATLTGAARIALGTELPALFCNDDAVAHEVVKESNLQNDPVWRMPLFAPYRELLNTPFADLNNTGSDVYGGAITAALFLKEFVPDEISWLHYDLMAWNLKTKPGRPQGGEAMAIRGLYAYLQQRYG